MGFEVDYKNAEQGGTLLPKGEYEVIIKYAVEDVAKSGKPYINIPMIIRNDVDQPRKGAYHWHSLWKRKEPTSADLAVGGYGASNINLLSKEANLGDGKRYASLDEWCKDLKNRLLRITIGHEEYNGKKQAKIENISATKYPTCNHVFKKSQAAVPAMPVGGTMGGVTPIAADDDDELPF